MLQIKSISTAIALALSLFVICGAAAAPMFASPIVIGGFDAARGGLESITTDIPLQNAVVAAFPGASFTATSALTPGYLATVNDLIIGVGTASHAATTPLSSAEQAALVNFVKSGGNALLYTDNDTFSGNASIVNNSFVSPFGLATFGTLGFSQLTTIVNGTNPVVSGPFGTATAFNNDWPGWFSSLGAAQELATLNANGEPIVAVLMPGSLGAGSGAVVFFGDSAFLFTGSPLQADVNDTILALNSLALQASTTPEPSSVALFGAGVLGLAGVLRRKVTER